jgi:L-fuconolactonase
VRGVRLDAHQHFWALANPFTRWPTPELAAIYRDYQPADLRGLLQESRIDATVLVQASPDVAESLYLLDMAAHCDFVKAVVGWIDFESADALGQLTRLGAYPVLKGLRVMVQDIPERRWLLRREFAPIFAAMIARGLRLDALVRRVQLPDVLGLSQHYPELAIVVDHAGKPDIAGGEFDTWARDIERLAQQGNVCCKLSGLWTEAGADHSVTRIRPYVRHLLGCFGPARLMWGSDWPVLELAGRYTDWLGQCEEELLAQQSQAASAEILGVSGCRFYGLDTD